MDNEKWFRVLGYREWTYWSNVKEAVLRGLLFASHPDADPRVTQEVVDYLKTEFYIFCEVNTFDDGTIYAPETPFSDRTKELIRWYHNSKDMEG